MYISLRVFILSYQICLSNLKIYLSLLKNHISELYLSGSLVCAFVDLFLNTLSLYQQLLISFQKWQKRLEKRRRQNRRNRTDVLSSRGRARQSTKTTGSGSSASVGKELDSSSAAAGGPSAEGSDDGDNVRHRGSSSSSSSSSSPPNSINGNGGGKRRGGQGYGSFNLDDLQNGYRHGGRYYSKELAQLHRYKLAALRELLE